MIHVLLLCLIVKLIVNCGKMPLKSLYFVSDMSVTCFLFYCIFLSTFTLPKVDKRQEYYQPLKKITVMVTEKEFLHGIAEIILGVFNNEE